MNPFETQPEHFSGTAQSLLKSSLLKKDRILGFHVIAPIDSFLRIEQPQKLLHCRFIVWIAGAAGMSVLSVAFLDAV